MNIRNYLGQKVDVVIDRPLGSKHPKHGFTYEVNYGHLPGTKAPDGEEIDAYVLGVEKPLNIFSGVCIAIIHRTNNEDDKLIIVEQGWNPSDVEIEKSIEFQEKWFKHVIFRKKSRFRLVF